MRMVRCPQCRTQLFSTSEAAKQLGVDARTIQRWAAAGRFPHAVKDSSPPGRGPRWLIPEYDLSRS
jgi:excisionase family DNA binding protein